MKIVYLFILIAFPVTTFANNFPASITEECTTNERIYNESNLRVNASIDKTIKREAILKALGVSTSNPNFAVHTFKGQWFYEHENDDAIFVGYKIRNHYLSVAIIYTEKGLSTIICNSNNLKQTEESIHKKASVWKDTLNSNIRVEIGNVLRGNNSNHIYLKNLDRLKSAGFITDDEYKKIKKRIESK